MRHLSDDHKDCPNQHGNGHKLFNEKGHPLWKKSIETEATTWSEFSNGRKATVEQILGSQEGAELWESQPGILVGKLTIQVRLFEIEKSPGLSVLPE